MRQLWRRPSRWVGADAGAGAFAHAATASVITADAAAVTAADAECHSCCSFIKNYILRLPALSLLADAPLKCMCAL